MIHKIDRAALAATVRDLQGISSEDKTALLELINDQKKFGLVWEDNPEEAQELLRTQIPYLREDSSLKITCETKDAPNHIMIEGENLHALAALSYAYEGKIDVIYIDPPYNSGARDWRYNNDYVDSNDTYRHSHWLSMMRNRLRIAKRLLNPNNSVLIVTIDEKEFYHLGCLLEDMFITGRIQMISTVINVKGVAREKEFSRVNEYIYIVQLGDSKVEALPLSEEWLGNVRSSGRDKVRLGSMLRSGSNSERKHSPGCFYPMLFTTDGKFVMAGEPIPFEQDRNSVKIPDGLVAIWPIHANGTEGVWQYGKSAFEKLVSEGFVYFGKLKNNRIGISYAPKGVRQKIKNGLFKIEGYNEEGQAIIDDTEYQSTFIPGNQWAIPSHNATEYGSKLLKDIFGEKVFSYPKSLYAVMDTLRFFVANKKNATILDYFAGSGTTLHATMMLNEEDGGARKCILVNNAENNICTEVTYERCKRVIEGYTNQTGQQVEGLKENNLRFYRIDFVPREQTTENKQRLIEISTDILCIKHNLYVEQTEFLGLKLPKQAVRYFAEQDRRLLIIYRPETIPYIVKALSKIKASVSENPIQIYVACDGTYPYTDDFSPVLEHVELHAMPYSLIQAYRQVLPTKAKAPDYKQLPEVSEEELNETDPTIYTSEDYD